MPIDDGCICNRIRDFMGLGDLIQIDENCPVHGKQREEVNEETA